MPSPDPDLLNRKVARLTWCVVPSGGDGMATTAICERMFGYTATTVEQCLRELRRAGYIELSPARMWRRTTAPFVTFP